MPSQSLVGSTNGRPRQVPLRGAAAESRLRSRRPAHLRGSGAGAVALRTRCAVPGGDSMVGFEVGRRRRTQPQACAQQARLGVVDSVRILPGNNQDQMIMLRVQVLTTSRQTPNPTPTFVRVSRVGLCSCTCRAGGRRSGFEDGDSVAGGGRAGALSASRKSSSSAGALRAGSMETEHLPESGSRSRSNPRRIADSEPELPDSLQPTVLDDDSNSDDGGKSDGRLGPADGLGQHSRGVGQQRPHTSGSGSSAAAGSIGEVGAAREAEAAAAAAGAHARPRTAASDVSSLTRLSEESGTYM